MNTSQFMDKQIMEFSGMQTSVFSDLLNSKDERDQKLPQNGGGSVEDLILPSYEFQPIRTAGSKSTPLPFANSTAIHEKATDEHDMDMLAEIDRAVKKHSDNLLHAVEGISSRLSQLETRTHHLEISIDDLKMSVGANVGITDGKLRQLENILREVQTGVQVLRDKKENPESQQLSAPRLQASTSENQYIETVKAEYNQQQSHPQPPFQQPPRPTLSGEEHPALPVLPAVPSANVVPPPAQQNPPTNQFPGPQTQIPSVPSLSLQQSLPPPSQPQDALHQQYQVPVQGTQPHIPSVPSFPPHPSLPPPIQPQDVTHQQYQVPVQGPQPQPQPQPQQHYQLEPHLPQYSQPPQAAHVQPPLANKPEEISSYMLSLQTYPSTMRPPSMSSQPPSIPLPQNFYGPNSTTYEPSATRPGPGPVPSSVGYGAQPGPGADPYHYSSRFPHYGSSSVKPPFSSSSSALPGRGNDHPRLPTAKILPQATPVGSSSTGESTGNRVPIDDVVDKVATMGFSREQVRATVRKLTENGQSVDLNVVLDKLMNGGGGW